MSSQVKIALVAMLVILSSGCAHRPEPIPMDEIVNGRSVIIVADAVVIHDSTLGEPVLKLADNTAVATTLVKIAANEFMKRGYEVVAPAVISVGMSPSTPKKVALEQTTGKQSALTVSDKRPFMLENPNAIELRTLELIHNVAFAHEQISPSVDSTRTTSDQSAVVMKNFSNSMLVVVSGTGHYISGGQIAGNVAKGMLNVVAAIGGSSRMVDMEQDKTTVFIKVYEQQTGRLIWKGDNYNHSNPVPDNFAALLMLTMSTLPERKQAVAPIKLKKEKKT